MSDAPPDRVAGAIVITDGEVHDAPDPRTFHLGAPFHVLVTGAPGERDRKLTVVRATRYNIVGSEAQITFRVDDFGGSAGGNAAGRAPHRRSGRAAIGNVPVGRDTTISVPVAHGGENVVELEAAAGPAEQTLQNNRAAVMVNGVRDRLRVLLVSGEPHAGERVWRNLLKADPSVDLVHFTILRPPEKLDCTPINELALIQFPTRQLFAEKLSEFDLVILDRYQNRDLLPLAYFENLAKYVENGGALLLSSGSGIRRRHQHLPHASRRRASGAADGRGRQRRVQARDHQGRLRPSRDARPAARQSRSGPRRRTSCRSICGRRPRAARPRKPAPPKKASTPNWGRWFRVITAETLAGNTLMAAPQERPLLVLDRVQKGRVAQLLSDQIWLWARGYENGGPQAELLRRLAHWLMKEPDLEEERLMAEVAGGDLRITRQTMAEQGGRSEGHEPDRQGVDRAARARPAPAASPATSRPKSSGSIA